MFTWSKKYGPVYKIRLPFGEIIMVSDYDSIHQVLVSGGNVFGGRPKTFRLEYVTHYDSLVFRDSDAAWRVLRKLSHVYLKSFGSGMARQEAILSQPVLYIVQEFESRQGVPTDTLHTLKEAALSSTSVLLLG